MVEVWWAVIPAIVLGLAVGSFLNVAIHRIPAGASVVSPRSSCPECGHRIRSWDNIPVVSWVVLRGRCRDCGAAISVRYPLVEVGTAAAFGLVAWWWFLAGRGIGIAGDLVILVVLLWFAAVSIALTAIDLDVHRLPNAIVYPSAAVASAGFTLAALLGGRWVELLTAFAGAAILGLIYLGLALIRPGGMGLGDVKLAALVGLHLGWFGWAALAVGVIATFLLGGLFGLILLVSGRAGRNSKVPFGPWILLGGWLGIITGPSLMTLYLGSLGITGG